MADPFSLAAAIAGLISLSLEVTKIAHEYIQGVRNSSKDIEDFLQELAALTDVLRQLDVFLKKDEAGKRSFDQTSVLVKTYKACCSSLEKTRLTLQRRVNEHNFLKALTWPFVGKQHQQIIVAILHWIHTFQFALTIEGCVLLSKTAGEVSKTLNNQLRILEETKKIAQSVPYLLESTEKASNSIHGVLCAVSSLAELQKHMVNLEETVRNIERIVLESHEQEWRESTDRKKQQVLQWLSCLDFRPKQLDILSRRTPSTGEWLLVEEKFKAWVDGSGSSLLLCSGIPGAGKTVLTSLVIDHLESRRAAIKPLVAYVFFDYKDQKRQTATAILRSLLKQVVEFIGEIPESVQRCYDAKKPAGDESTMDEGQCISLLEHLIGNVPCGTFLIFDALDECPEIDDNSQEVRSKITSAMKRLASVGRVFITARPHVHPPTVSPECHRLEIRATNPDMRCYIDARIKAHKRLLQLVGSHSQLADRVKETLCRKVNGMFLLARLQMDSLVTQTSPRHVLKALESLPEGLNETFGDTIDRIRSQSEAYWKLAKRVISWIFYSKRPLQISELVIILAVEAEDTKFDPLGLHEKDLILEVCCGLVSIDEQDGTVRLVHYSLQEYLIACWHGHWPKAEETVAATCMAYLTLEDVSVHTLASFAPAHCGFLSYALNYWGEHLRGPFEVILEKQICRLLEITTLPSEEDRFRRRSDGVPFTTTPAHVVASLGLNHLVSVILKRNIDLEAQDSQGYTPLGRAVRNQQTIAVGQLLAHGANPNAEVHGHTLLSIATELGHSATMELLIDYGGVLRADELLVLVACTDEAAVLQCLLDRMPLTDEVKSNALVSCAQFGRVDLVHILLRARTNPNWTDTKCYQTALTMAITCCQQDVVVYLLAAGAEPNLRSRNARIPLHLAVSLRYEPAIDALIALNADPHLLDIFGRSCLDLAYPDENLLNKLGGKLATYVPTNAVVKERCIREAIIDILRSFYTIWWCSNSDDVMQQMQPMWRLNTLGHCLLLIGERADARTCFENSPSIIICDGCTVAGTLEGRRFVCGSCADTDLCETCMDLQKSQTPPLPSCRDHEFLEMAEPWLVKYEEGRVNEAGETFREWLTRLAQCYLDEEDYEKLRKELHDDDGKENVQVEERKVEQSDERGAKDDEWDS